MTKKELFKKYFINESHNVWLPEVDNWVSVEVYRLMHDGKLPPGDDKSVDWICCLTFNGSCLMQRAINGLKDTRQRVTN